MDIQNPEALARAARHIPDLESLKTLGNFFQVMADPGRLQLLMALQAGELCPSDLAILAGISRSAVSHKLKDLRQAKLVKARKEGKTVYYSLDDDHIHQVLRVAFEHILED